MGPNEVAEVLKSEDEWGRVTRLMDLLDTADEAVALRSALEISVNLVAEVESGCTLLLQKPDGAVNEVVFRRQREIS